jgi:metacaspase-1
MAKRAVLIGVNRYRIPGADLRGCVNDVVNMQKVLTQRYGFAKGDITTLVDYGATQKAMQAAISGLVKGGKKGDVLLVHFSGHGSNVPDDNGDEADKRDEILCPTDLDWKNPFRDDWLRKTFDGLKAGVNLTVITDCCHSGTITRAVRPPDAEIIERYLPSPWDLVAVESGRRLRGTRRSGLHPASLATRSKRDIIPADLPEVLISGCRADQTSADAFIGGSYNGALTYCMAAAINESRRPLTHRELHDGTIAKLKKGRYAQVPQLECTRARLEQPFLSPIA